MFRFVNKNHSFGFRVALVLGVVFATVLGATPAQAYTAIARTTYIVQVKTGAADAVRAAIGKLGETPHDELTEVMDGFVLDMTEIEASTLRSDANVVQVVADQSVSMLDTQTPTPSWGLDRLDQTNTTYDNTYTYPASAGAGVKVYVVDTGVMASDPDFTGRVETGVDLLGQNLQGADCNGHGTHVAGTIAGTKYGVAKKATIVPIRVLGCGGSGSMSTIVSAIDWIIANNPAGTPAVMSASIGGGKYQLVNDAIEKLYQAGITPVIAAGNANADAAGYSPASAPNAITVGASDRNDTRAYFSNFGDLVDVFAPGVDIVSDNYLDSTTGRVLSGTSMATPHVSGLVALYLADHKTATPAQVAAAIQAGAQAGVIVDAKSANGNFLINTKFISAALPPVGAPTNVVVSAITATSATVSWTAPAGTQAAASYKVEYKDSAATTWSSVDSATTTANLTGLTVNSTYSVRVLSIAGSVTSPASAELVFSTLADVPDAVTNLRATAIFGSQITLAWDAPANANGSKITGYEVWVDNAGTWSKKMTVSVTTANLTALQPSTSYSLRVLAVNAIGSSLPSATLAVSTTSATPAMVALTTRANLTATGMTLNWNAVAPIESATPISYSVVITNSATATVVGTYTTTTPTITFTGLTHYTLYSVVVTAYSGTVAGPGSNPYTFRTLADVPSAPTGVSAAKTTTGQYNITWTGPRDSGGSAITQYKVEQFVAGAWTLIATNDVTVANLLVPSPAAGASEQYRVSAVNAIGTGPAAPVTVTGTVTVSSEPTGLTLTAAAGSLTAATLAWIAPVNNGGAAVSSYIVYRSIDGGTTWSTLVSALTTLNYNVALPPKGSTYLFSVAAVNSAGVSAKATSVSYTSTVSVAGSTGTPVLTWNTDGSLKIVWTAPTDNGGSAITSYKVQRLVGTTWATVATVATTTASLPREAAGTSYSIRVVAVNAIGDGAASAVSSIVVPAAKSSAPLNLTATTVGAVVTLAWQAPASNGGAAVTAYGIQLSTNAGMTWSALGAVNTLTVNFTAPPKGQSYQYRVYAVTSAGNGDFSNVATVATNATAPGSPSMRSIGFATDGSLQVTWLAPGDNGGSPITGYRVEYSTNATTFNTLSTVAANVLSVTIAREAPGVRSYVRVYAITALGESAAGSTLSLATPALKASAPQNFTAVDAATYVTLTWAAPANLGGSTTVNYTIQMSTNGGTNYSTVTTVAGLTANVARPVKGTTALYRVVANTAAGLSDFSNVATVSIAATVAGAPSWSFVGFNGNGSIDLRWLASGDTGGSAITAFVVEKSYDQTNWTTVNTSASATNTSLNIPRENPGVRIYFRVSTVNAIGTSAKSSVASIAIPYLKATAPQNFSATDGTTYVSATWTAPANLGGSATVTYSVQVSKDNGATWATVGATVLTTLNVVRPAKGTTWQYRVVANTAFGLSDYSSVVTIAIAATAPSTPAFTFIGLNTAASAIDIRWNAASDNGGSTITSYVVQKSADGINFSTVATTSGTTLSANVTRDAPGVRAYWRIAAVNAIGSSAFSSNASVQMPFVQASAVQNFTATDNGSFVTVSWSAPADLGGSTSIYYYVQYSTNGGATWLNYVSTVALTYNVARPAKGTTSLYRAVAVTSFGVGQNIAAVSITAAATAPSVPSVRSYVLNPDLTSTLTFNASSDTGGSPITRYVVETSNNGTTWAVLTNSAAAGAALTIAPQAPGVRIYVRVSAANAIGTSAPSSYYSVAMPLVQASAVQNLAINNSSTSYVVLNWAAPSNLGGAASVSSYQVQSTIDGSNWTVVGSTTALTATISRPGKGVAISYRVLASTGFGLGLPSATVAATVINTVASAPLVTSAVKSTTSNSFVIGFNQPGDLGGFTAWSYKVQVLQGSAWVTVASAAGSATNSVQIASPAVGVLQSVRVIATNSVGDSSPYTFSIRG